MKPPNALPIAATRARLGLARLVVLNDFEALALSLPELRGNDLDTVRGGVAEGERRAEILVVIQD